MQMKYAALEWLKMWDTISEQIETQRKSWGGGRGGLEVLLSLLILKVR